MTVCKPGHTEILKLYKTEFTSNRVLFYMENYKPRSSVQQRPVLPDKRY